MKKSSADYWAPRISAEWRKSVEGIVRVGLALVAAKAACEHGEFLRLFKGHPQAVADPVPFGKRTAERLMKVASHSVLSDATHASHLPQSWMTLHELAMLEDELVLAGIASGEIAPEMTRSQAATYGRDKCEVLHAGVGPADAVGAVLLPRWIRAMAEWTDEDAPRFPLGHLLIESDGSTALVVATDGRRMAMVTVPQRCSEDGASMPVSAFLVSGEDLARALKGRAKRQHTDSGDGSYVSVRTYGDGTACILGADGSDTAVPVSAASGRRYPNWRSVMQRYPNESERTQGIRFNPSLLADVSCLANAAGATTMEVGFYDDALAGAFETIDGCCGRVVVMGCNPSHTAADLEVERERLRAGVSGVVSFRDDVTPKHWADIAPTVQANSKPICIAIGG